jgi:hypothetical protein
MRKVLWAAALPAAAMLGGCASITSGTTQDVSVTAVCEGSIVPAASCELVNDKGRWQITTPGAAVIQKAYGDLVVVCRKSDTQGTATFISKPNGGAWGNILAGGLIGYAVDSSNGAGFNYPSELPVVMVPPCPQHLADSTNQKEEKR